VDHVISIVIENNITRWPNDSVIHLAAICKSVLLCDSQVISTIVHAGRWY